MSIYQNVKTRVKLARELASEAIVLLKNKDHCLPLAEGRTIALLGRAQNAVVISGGGSGVAHSKQVLQISEEMKKNGLGIEPHLETFYQALYAKEQEQEEKKQTDFSEADFGGLISSGLIYELFGKYQTPADEPLPEESLICAAAKATDTAVLVIGRSAGSEECDRHIEDDYYLLDSEKELIRLAASCFSKIIVVFNICGLVDMSWTKDYPQIKAMILMGTLGEQGAGALVDILVGKITPSGKLSQTVALRYEDYPSADHFSFDKSQPEMIKTYADYGLSAEENGSVGFELSPVTVYAEQLYVGYRYFDSFQKEVLYPFGFGESYAEFTWSFQNVSVADGKVVLHVRVKNSSDTFSGKETVQLYVHAVSPDIEVPYQELKAFAKTRLLSPGEEQILSLEMLLTELAHFSPEERAWIIRAGGYQLMLGTHSGNTQPVVTLHMDQGALVSPAAGCLDIAESNRNKIPFIHPDQYRETVLTPQITVEISASDLVLPTQEALKYDFSVPAETSVLSDVAEGRVSMEAFLNQMTLEELVVLCNGYGTGLPFGGIGSDIPKSLCYEDGTEIGYGSHETAFLGYMSPAVKKYGIYSASYRDAPSTVGLVAWPSGMMLGCTFNTELLYQFGDAIGLEAESKKVDSWLAPGMNILRNPLQGRSFEYFSEDPILCGFSAASIIRGAQENHRVTACPKHFALNEQETYRRGSQRKNIDATDSIVDERTARELYLKPFELAVRLGSPLTVMTSFNKINGTFAGGSKELNTHILREEWGFQGVVVTDWGDMDIVVDGADAVAAGNDVVMPGGPPVIHQVLDGFREGRVNLTEIKTAVAHLMNFVMHSASFYDKTEAADD